jgi:hypothetical protein
MPTVKIQIPDREDRVKCLVELARRGRVICLPDNVFVVGEQALELLDELGVHHIGIGLEGSDTAEKALSADEANPDRKGTEKDAHE